MRLNLFEIFGVQIKSYGFMIAVGIIAASIIVMKRSREKGYNEDHILNLIIFAVFGGILGGKGLFIITEWKEISKDFSILADLGYGFVIYGAIFGGLLAIILYCRFKKWSVFEILDMAVPGVAIAQGFGRIGCFLAGCCYGAPTDSPLGVVFPEGSLAPSGTALYPTQIFSSVFDFILGIILLYYYKAHDKEKGSTCGLYLICYSVGRFCIEFLRNDPRGNVGILSTSQFIAVFTLIAGIIIINKDRFKKKKAE